MGNDCTRQRHADANMHAIERKGGIPILLVQVEEKIWVDLFSCLKVEARYVGFSQMKNVPSARQKCAAIQVAIDKAATEQVCLVLEATPLLLFWCHLWVVTLEGLTGVVCE